MKLILALTLLASSISSCAAPAKGPGPILTSTGNLNKEKILKLVNEARSKGRSCGTTKMAAVAPLAWHDKLELAAQNHSDEMDKYNFFSHASRNGSNAGKRINAAGYSWTAFGENIGQGFTSEEEAVREWLGSPGHCRNIMSPDFKEIGVARQNSYWTMVFGRR